MFEEVETCETIDELNLLEQKWITYYDSTNKDKGYNLDYGGKNGLKSEETKRKIGRKTKDRFNNPDIKQKLLDGLKKGIQTQKKKALANKKEKVCPLCGKTFSGTPWYIEKKKFCSVECVKQDRVLNEKNTLHLLELSKNNVANINKRRQLIKNDTLNWCLKNKEAVLSCPYNKVSVELQPLSDYIFEKYNIKDLRSVAACFDLKNKKDLLKELKEYLLSF